MEKITQKQFREQVNNKILNRIETGNNLTYHNVIELIENIKTRNIKLQQNNEIGIVHFTNPQRMVRKVTRDNKIIDSHLSLKNYKIYKHKDYYIAIRKYYLDNEETFKYWYILYNLINEL